MTHHQDLSHWPLAHTLSVVQAAHLILGRDPSTNSDDTPEYVATLSALNNAVLDDSLAAKKRFSARERGYNEEPEDDERLTQDVQTISEDWLDAPNAETRRVRPRVNGVIYRPTPDSNLTTVSVQALREWLASRGLKPPFFFPDEPSTMPAMPGYLDPQHPRYAPKLAASIFAWNAVGSSPSRMHPKQALLKWLAEHADEFGLSNQGIEESAAVANWRPGGPAKASGE